MVSTSKSFIRVLAIAMLAWIAPRPSSAFEKVSEGQVKAKNTKRYEFAQAHGAQFVQSSDGQTVGILWFPAGLTNDPNKRLLVSLHGHASLATDEFFLWQKYAEKYRFGIFALQWWDLGDEVNPRDYLKPNEIYRIVDNLAKDQKIKSGRAFFHGFSMGSANSYAVMALDRDIKRDLFGACISNAGGLEDDFPGNRIFLADPAKASIFKGTHWVMYCGEKENVDSRSGVNAMKASKQKVEALGGSVDLFIQDPTGDHGGFHRNSQNTESAMKAIERLIPR